MSDRKGHRKSHVSHRTQRRRHPRKLTKEQSAIGKRMRDQAYSFDVIAEALGVHRDAVLAESGKWKDMAGADHGNAVLNVRPDTRDAIRKEFQKPGDAMHVTVDGMVDELRYHRAMVQAMNLPPYSGLTPEPVLPLDQAIH